MNKNKIIPLKLVIISVSLSMGNNAFAVGTPPSAQVDVVTKFDGMTKEEYIAYKQAKGEEQRALALSTLPQVVGEDILEQEADGMYLMPQQALDNWGQGRMFPSSSAMDE